MPEHPITPIAITRYDTVSQQSELLDGPAATPYRFNWRAVHGAQLAQDFKLALKKLEGLMYVFWGSQPDYAGQKQWYTREHPRCRWGAEQWWEQPTDQPPPPSFWNYLETAALGQIRSGAVPTAPVRSRSGDPQAQFKRSQHSQYFPVGSVERYCGAPGNTGHQVHDPASSYKQFPAWPNAQSVVIRYTRPPAVTNVEWLVLVTSHDLYPMYEVEPGVWEATIQPRTQGDYVWWYLLANFNGQPQAHHDPFVGVDAQGNEIEPARRGALSDPEHVGSSVTQRHENDAYYFTFFSHYNPYANGLPELLDENEPGTPGNWLRRGTDGYRFDFSENIQPGLINLARFVLDHIGSLVQHHPGSRGSADLCCLPMHIAWRWSGANVPDLYRGGGKGGAAGSSPLHNHPDHLNAGSSDARESWRGIEMAWQNASDVPGFFPDNWWYGDNESWLAWPSRLTLDPDPLNPPFQALMRDYGDRGLHQGDAIDPVHLLEIIDAVDYLISNGLVLQVPIHTAPYTFNNPWGHPCGWSETYSSTCDQFCDENPELCAQFPCDGESVAPERQCCAGWSGNDCIPFTAPAWADCNSYGKCALARRYSSTKNKDEAFGYPDGYSTSESVVCNADDEFFGLNDYLEYAAHPFGGVLGVSYTPCGGGDCGASTMGKCQPAAGRYSAQFGASFYLCGPDQTPNGPEGDPLHGNGFTKDRFDGQGNYSVNGPSMGNRLANGSVHACASPTPGSGTPDFYAVTPVVDYGVAGGWWKFAAPADFGPVPSAPPPIPGLGLWYLDDPLYTFTSDASTWADLSCTESLVQQTLSAEVAVIALCSPDIVYAAVDLNLQGGIPTLYDYALNIAAPFDDCPCRTWTGPGTCA